MTQTTNPKYSVLSKGIVDVGNWCQKRILDVVWEHKLSLIELMVATVFSLTAYYYTEKFSPLDLPVIPSYSTLVTYDKKTEAVYSTYPLPLEFITHEVSGKIKNVYAVTVASDLSLTSLSIQSLMDDKHQFRKTTEINLGGEEWAEIAHQLVQSVDNTNGIPGLFIVPGAPPRANTVSIVIEDYTGNKELFTYVIYTTETDLKAMQDGKEWLNLHFIPVKYLDFWHPTDVNELYKAISWENDPFWKSIDIRNVEDFKHYLRRLNIFIRGPFNMFDASVIEIGEE